MSQCQLFNKYCFEFFTMRNSVDLLFRFVTIYGMPGFILKAKEFLKQHNNVTLKNLNEKLWELFTGLFNVSVYYFLIKR